MNQVTPNLEHIPERTYKRNKNVIRCYEIMEHNFFEGSITTKEKPLFVLEMKDAEAANLLMDDLYHGEYTGA